MSCFRLKGNALPEYNGIYCGIGWWNNEPLYENHNGYKFYYKEDKWNFGVLENNNITGAAAIPEGGCFKVGAPDQYKDQFYSGEEHKIYNSC